MSRGTQIVFTSIFGAVAITKLSTNQQFTSATISAIAVLLCLAQWAIWGIYTTFVYPRFITPLRHLPGPKDPNWLMGQLYKLVNAPSGSLHRAWVTSIPNNGLLYYTFAFNRGRVLLTNPKALAEVLVHKNYDFEKPSFFQNGLGQLLGIGVLLAEGEEHKRQRKALMPAFQYRHVKALYPIFWRKGREVVLKMSEEIARAQRKGEPDANVLNAAEWASRVTLDIIGVAGMGYDFGAIQDPNAELAECYRKVFEFDKARIWFFVLQVFLPWAIVRRLPLARNPMMQKARSTIRRTAANLIMMKKAALQEGKLIDKDIISVAIESGGFTDENLTDQLMTFLAAGHETTATAMQWATLLMCQHPDVQQRLREEIRTKMPSITDSSSTLSAELIDGKMPYLSAVCNEILRFYPPVPVTMRTAVKDTTICGEVIPKGLTVVISPWAINHSPELWGPDADKFDPERFLKPGQANAGGANSNYSYLTFLHGPRSCIGQQFAKVEFMVLLAAWVGRFEMELADKDYKLEITGEATAKPKHGVKIRVKELQGW